MRYQLTDLIKDKSFVNWVHQVNKEDSLKWESYVQQNPQQQPLIKEAAFIVKGIPFAPKPVNPQRVEEQWQRLRQHLVKESLNLYSPPAPRVFKNYRYVVVPLLGVLLGVVSYWYLKLN